MCVLSQQNKYYLLTYLIDVSKWCIEVEKPNSVGYCNERPGCGDGKKTQTTTGTTRIYVAFLVVCLDL